MLTAATRCESFDRSRRFEDERLTTETEALLESMTETVNSVEVVDRLVRELKRAGIWGRLGEISWVRDAGAGVLIQWTPSSQDS